MNITYRSVKGSKLTSDEVDGNFLFLENQVSGGNRFTAFTGFSLAGQNLTLNASSAWVINTVSHTNASAVVINIPYAASGMERIDLIVANASGAFVREAGVESASNPVAPVVPVNTVMATFISVTDGTVGTGTTPIVGAEFLKKNEFYEVHVTDSGNIAITLDTESTAFRLTGAVTSVTGFEMTSDFISTNNYIGKEIKLVNNTGADIPIAHNGAATYPARFPSEVDFVWKDKEVILFKPVKTDTLHLEFCGVGRDAYDGGVTPKYATLTSSQLTSRDVAGFVTYANALSPNLAIAANEFYDFIVTDTGQIFKLYKSGVTIGLGQTAITASDVKEIRVGTSEILQRFTGDEYSVQATGSALSLYGMATPTTVGTASNVTADYSGTYASNPIAFSVHRSSSTGTTIGNIAEFYENTHKLVANGIGFVFHGKESFTWVTGCASCTGLTGSNAATGNVNPSSILNSILYGADDTDTNLQFIHNDGSGTASKHDMGSNFALQSNNAYRFMIWNFYGSNTVYIWVLNLRNGAVYQTSVNTDLPAITVGLAPHLWTGNRATANNVAQKFSYYKLQRQY